MNFLKIQLTRKNTLNVVYKDGANNIVTVNGANIVHKDLKQAMNGLIPHIAMITEQRETQGRTLKQVEAERITDANSQSVHKLMTVDTVTINDDQTTVMLTGNRILQTTDVITISTPNVEVANKEKYKYGNELDLAVDAVKYEAKLYLDEQKWGVKEGDLQFADDDPFKGVKADEVESADIKPAKRGRKAKKEAV